MRLLISLLFPLLIWPSISYAGTDPTPKTLDELKGAIEQIRKETNTLAVGIALANKEGPLWVAGLGEADTEKHNPADENTLFRIGKSCKNQVRILFNDKSAFIKKSLNQIEDRLPRKFFFRANRQYIVNLHAIINIEEGVHDGYLITMNDGKEIEISRRQASDLKELLSL